MADAGQKFLADEQATAEAGADLAHAALQRVPLEPFAVMLYLSGDLGAGKTSLARGIIRALGHRGAVRSPTYTLLEPYDETRVPVCHFDLYRLGDPSEVEFLGVEDCFASGRLCLVEWPDRGESAIPTADLALHLCSEGAGRRLEWEARTPAGRELIRALPASWQSDGYDACR